MNDYPEKVKQQLNAIMADMSEHYWLFANNPGHDFTRQNLGKLSFEDTIRLILSMGKGSVSDELIDFFEMDADRIPTPSAFNQRRSQISEYAFEHLFREFASNFPQTTHQFKGKCILAADGCHVVYTTNAQLIEDYHKPRMEEYRGYNHMHLNGFIDVISKAFLDVVIQPGQKPDERLALHTMLDHFEPDDPSKYIITADRGYESYDLIFHCECKKLFYVFRVKAPSSPKSILSTYKHELPDEQEEFDIVIKRFFTGKRNKIMKEQSQVYFYIHPDRFSTYLKELMISPHIAYVQFRVVKIKTADNVFEYIITNLPGSFDISDIKDCYHWRWGIEITFRYLKHAAGLLYFHSKKPAFLKQEIYASLVLYNFGVLLANEAAAENRRKKRRPGNKHQYSIDFTTSIKTARKFFCHKPSEKQIDVIRLLGRFVHAIKEDFRQFDRHLRSIGAIRFSYR